MYPFRKTATAGMCFPTTRLVVAALLASVAPATGAVAAGCQNHVMPFFSKNLCFIADCR